MSIVIGLGTGRCGTMSLADLLNGQRQSVCFHELNPGCMSWSESYGTVFSMLRDFKDILEHGPHDRLAVDLTGDNNRPALEKLRSLAAIDTIGDVGFYYLPYVERILTDFPEIKFPCLKRDKAATVQSYVKKMEGRRRSSFRYLFRKRPLARNHFVEEDRSRWRRDARWDKCYPKFVSDSLEDALGQYWDHYYQEADRLAALTPQLRVFATEDLNTEEGQAELLEFCGIDEREFLSVNSNQS